MSVDSLIKKRGNIKALLTRFQTFLEKCASGESKYLSQIQFRVKKIEEVWQSFHSVHEELEHLDPGRSEDYELELTNFEDTYFESLALAERFGKGQQDQGLAQPDAVLEHTTASINSQSTQVKLPQISVPTFSGRFEDWIAFRELFTAIIDKNQSLDCVHKLYYLKQSLKGGSADGLIDSIDLTGQNYDTAWQLLIKRYQNERVITERHLKTFFELPKLERESSAALRELIDKTNIQLKALNSLGQPVDSWDTLIVYILTTKLDYTTCKEWQSNAPVNRVATLTEFTEFINKRAQTLEAISSTRQTKVSTNNKQETNKIQFMRKNSVHHAVEQDQIHSSKCVICKDAHKIFACPSFNKMSIQLRKDKVNKLKLCLNCLRQGHYRNDCKINSKCRICNQAHNTLLHDDGSQSKPKTEETPQSSNPTQATVTFTSEGQARNIKQILLATALVDVVDATGSEITCRALLDPGSSINIISEPIAQLLKLHRRKINTCISGVSTTETNAQHMITTVIKSKYTSYQQELDFVVLPKVTQPLPNFKLEIAKWKIPKNLFLADPHFYHPSKIDLLIGAEIFYELLCIGQIKLHHRYPLLQKTTLGWIISGRIPEHNESIQRVYYCQATTNEDISQQIERFWHVEEVNYDSTQGSLTGEEAACEKLFIETTRRTDEGRFVVHLPFKQNISNLGNSRETALRRFSQLEKRLSKDEDLRIQYHKFMDEYIALEHMELIDQDVIQNPHYYVPHHAVVKPDSTTTKLRVVFDASCKTDAGISLNDCLMVGPVVQQDLFSIVVRFRKHLYALTADIEKMYRQVLVDSNQTSCQLILWRKGAHEPIKTFRLLTLTYGTASAPYLATRALKQLAVEYQDTYPEASRVTCSDFYVDDVLTGADSISEAKILQSQLIQLMKLGRFNLRKWCANDSRLLEPLPTESCEAELNYQVDNNNHTTKTLGIHWNARLDTLQYTINLEQEPRNHYTKRKILSEISRLFDPLGLVGPVLLRAKTLIQELWKLNLTWDESIPIHIETAWKRLRMSLNCLSQLRIPRCLITHSNSKLISLQLHTFADASEIGYGACVYLRCEDTLGNTDASLVCSKSRVAPIKKVTLPRLELCGATLAVELAQKTIIALNMELTEKYFWSDSTIVLSWIASATTNWNVFVANRIAKIQSLSKVEEWRHVKGTENPADLASRGDTPERLVNSSLWWHGPYWLTSTCNWNRPPELTFHTDESLPELKCKAQVHVTTGSEQFMYKYSSLPKLQGVVAYLFRFVNNCRCKNPSSRQTESLSVEELDRAMTAIVKYIQGQHFVEELKQLKNGHEIVPKSKLAALHPFLDKNCVIRVGGRLAHSDLDYNQKHPIVLPEKNAITTLIIRTEHVKQLHAGPLALLASLRLVYWPINGRRLVKKVVNDCLTCVKSKPKQANQLMGDLPLHRVRQARPFIHVGIDYCGPIEILSAHKRGAKSVKGYIALFVCMATRAIHVELVQELTTKSFIAALQRFMSRRGKASEIFSDNATNFVGAKNELKQLATLFSSKDHQTAIRSEILKHNINWNFIPPRAPHFGGLWEAGVKAVKYHLVRIVGKSLLTYEELYTVLCRIEGCLNSRPLTPLSSDPSDLTPLTPGHFLIGEPITALPERDETHFKTGRLDRWRRINQITQHFWDRWRRDFLAELQMRVKWKTTAPNVRIGTLVLIHEDNIPPLSWKLGRILQTLPGPDGKVRVVLVKTATKTLKRAITKICPLPMLEEDINETVQL